MRLISFDALRTHDMPDTIYIKPAHWADHLDQIHQADALLFPEYWQVNGLYYGLKKSVFPSISTYHIGHDKIEMTRVVQLLWPGMMPETLILPNTASARDNILEKYEFPFVAKAVRASMGTGVWLIEDRKALEHYIQHQDVLYVQEYLPIDRDMRLVVIGHRVVSAYWRRRCPDGFHTNVARGGQIEMAGAPAAAVALVEQIAQVLDIDHAGFDIAEVGGSYYFFEFNRLFGTDGLHRQGIRTAPLIYEYLCAKCIPPILPDVAA